EKLGIPASALEPYGHYKAKISLDYLAKLPERPNAKLILVTAISPTPAGEGKTTTTVGLGDGLTKIGKNALVCLREPSLGPVFGMKGGAAGGGHAQIVPMEDINLHFTGDFNAIALANNLLAALLDNHIHHGNALGIDVRRITWKRVVDMNDRALRDIVVSLGGPGNGYPREDGFDIVVPVLARDLNADGAMTVLLKDAFAPNLVQTLENTPAIVHGGPFANIAHGCNSVIASTSSLKLADYVVTEAGFGADLGAEKFVDIKCRKSGLRPSASVIVATIRALKFHGGVAKDDLTKENLTALEAGLVNLEKHIRNVRDVYGIRTIVSINHFTSDTAAEVELLTSRITALGAKIVLATHWADGGNGATELAHAVVEACEDPTPLTFVYPDEMKLEEKINAVATRVYGAAGVNFDGKAKKRLDELEATGYGHFPVCIAKTQYSFSTDANLKGAPTGHTLDVREIRLSAGAEFVVVVCGEIMTMPGLPKVPSSEKIDLVDGKVVGLF
ncbi:MAG: formate--tetrahydrofolate ligase, partial [Actinobacteria bacterium]|nr:formate--tetrahydrofolate ligase [Actinomycetota bacterium]